MIEAFEAFCARMVQVFLGLCVCGIVLSAGLAALYALFATAVDSFLRL